VKNRAGKKIQKLKIKIKGNNGGAAGAGAMWEQQKGWIEDG
jgi:hypothetical protein